MIMPVYGDDSFSKCASAQVESMVLAMIDSGGDKDETVNYSILTSLSVIGKKQPKTVLSSCTSYIKKHHNLPEQHRIIILNVMERIVKEMDIKLDAPFAVTIIKLASDEMTKSKDVVPDWQTAASGLLVAMGATHCHEAVEELRSKFVPGGLPHFFVIQTLANLSVASVYEVVPYLTEFLGMMLTMIGMVRHDNMKWVFSYALSKFSESILDYTANLEKAPDPTIKLDMYYTPIYSAFDVLFGQWLQSKESKLRLIIVEALGQMAHLISPSRLDEQLPRIVGGLQALYKKHPEPYHITLALCMVLDAAVRASCENLDGLFDSIMASLFPQVCVTPDYSRPLHIKNHNELLRCFEIMCRRYSDRLVAFLLLKLDGGNEKCKLGSLTVIKHLVNSASPQMENKELLILSGLKQILQESSNKVKKALAQLIIAMAHHGYLYSEGGELMIEFIVRQCSLTDSKVKDRGDTDSVSNNELTRMCASILNLMTTTISDMQSVLWPYMLELLIPQQYTGSCGVLCKNISELATLKRQECENGTDDDTYILDFTTLVNIPQPADMLARLFVLAGRPLVSDYRGIHVLNLLMALGPNIHTQISPMWDAVIPKLLKFIEDCRNEDTEWNGVTWEDLLLKLLSKTLDLMENDEWVCRVGSAMMRHVELYNIYTEDKNFLYKCMGVVMCKTSNKKMVDEILNCLFDTVKHNNDIEREGCARGVGLCAASHLDTTLEKLDFIMKRDMSVKQSRFMGLIKDRTMGDTDKIKSTIMLCYGHVTLSAPTQLITSRLESTILKNIIPNFTGVKDTAVKLNLIKAVQLVGKAMHPDHLKITYQFTHRDSLIENMMWFIDEESKTSITTSIRADAMDACSNLIKIDPIVSEAILYNLIQTCVNSVYTLHSVLDSNGGNTPTLPSTHQTDPSLGGDLTSSTMSSLNNLLNQILLKNICADNLWNIFKHVEKWREPLSARKRSINSVCVLLNTYCDNIQALIGSSFHVLGHIVGHLVPRCTDPDLDIRQQSMDCIQLLFRVQLRYDGFPDDHRDKMVEALSLLRERLVLFEPTVLFSVVNDLSKVLCKKIPQSQLSPFLLVLFSGLSDSQSHSSNGACVVLNSILKSRGSELFKEVSLYIEEFHSKLSEIDCIQTRTGTLRAFRTFTLFHLNQTLSVLFTYSLPYDRVLVDCWKIISSDNQLVQCIYDQILELMNTGLPYEEKLDPKNRNINIKYITHYRQAAVSALSEFFQFEECEQITVDNYHRLFAALLVNIGSCINVQPQPTNQDSDTVEKSVSNKKKRSLSLPKEELVITPTKVAVEAFQHFLMRTKCDKICDMMYDTQGWVSLSSDVTFTDGITTIARGLVTHYPQYIAKVVSYLTAVVSSLYEYQRVVVAVFFAELVNQRCGEDLSLIELLMNSLLGRLVDHSHLVRLFCIRGLANVSSVGTEQVQKFSTTVLSALISGMDDRDDPTDCITIEAISGLSRVLAKIDESHVRAILINISLRIRPCFEKATPEVRAAAFTLFGDLSRFCDGPSISSFLEQVHSNFISILLHLNDDDKSVKQSCKSALKQVGPLIGSQAINEIFQKVLLDDKTLHYGEFMNSLSKLIIADFSDKVNFYVMGNVSFFKALSPQIRCNAVMFVGFLLGNLQKDKQSLINKDHVCGALIQLLRDISPDVKKKTAEAMSLLADF